MKRELSKEQMEMLKNLAEMPDEQIDLSDIPETEDWSDSVVGKFYRPIKQSVTLRLDADVLSWLKEGGKGYQTRANTLLRAAMERQRQSKRHVRISPGKSEAKGA